MKKLFIFVIALLICSLGFAFTGIENASAATAQNPKWVRARFLLPLQARWTGKVPEVKVLVRYTNNSSDKVITAIYDKTLNLNYGTRLYGVNGRGDIRASNSYKPLWSKHRSNKVNRVRLDPGQSITLHYWVKISNKQGEYYGQSNIKTFTVDKDYAKTAKLKHRFKVKYEGI